MPQVVCKFIKKYPTVSGESVNGHWERTQFLARTVDDNQRLVGFTLNGERRSHDVDNVQPQQVVMVRYVPETREHGDRIYTDLVCLGIEVLQRN